MTMRDFGYSAFAITLALAVAAMGVYTLAVMGEPQSLWLMQSLRVIPG